MKTIEVFIEIPKGSSGKYEYKNKRLYLDRFLYGTDVYPGNYGYIENTKDEDNDNLDVLVLSSEPILSCSYLEVKVIGALDMIDNGEKDRKIICVPISKIDPNFKNFNSYKDLPQHQQDKIVNFFQQYKILEKKKVIIKGWLEPQEAWKIIKDCEIKKH